MRKLLAVLGGLCVVTVTLEARANGRFPGALQLVVRDVETALSTSFGVVSSSDRMRSTRFGCERALGYDPLQNEDVGIAVFPNGRIVMSGSRGLSTSTNGGCDSTRVGGLVAGRWMADVSVDEGNPTSGLALARSVLSGSCEAALFETTDQGASWHAMGTKLPTGFCPLTLDSAPTDPNRIYVSGNVSGTDAEVAGVVLTSRDRGMTWTSTTFAGHPRPFIGAMSPIDPDTFWVRTLAPPSSGALLVTHDAGQTFTEIASLTGIALQYYGVSGVAVSPDGKRIAYGSVNQGLFVADAAAGGIVQHRSQVPIACLAWAADGLYACSVPSQCGPFFVGRSTDEGATFETLLADTTLAPSRSACGPSTTASTCTAPTRTTDCAAPQAVSPTPEAPSEADPPVAPQPIGGCTCDVTHTRASGGASMFGAALALLLVRRRRARHATRPSTQPRGRR